MFIFLFSFLPSLIDSSIIYHQGEVIDEKNFETLLKNAQVVFVGEKHDNPFAHKWELEILKALHSSGKYALCMEMFERDVQNVLDNYLNGKISEEEFLKNSRPWPNYKTDYKPMVEYAKAEGIPVVASNIPRKEANLIAKGGEAALDSITKFSPYAHVKVFTNDTLYRERFYKTMEALKKSRMKKASIMKERFYLAQCLKDGVMAHSIMEWLDKGYNVLHVNGSFHSDYHTGIVYQLKKQRPELKILTIRVLAPEEEMDKDAADIIIRRK